MTKQYDTNPNHPNNILNKLGLRIKNIIDNTHIITIHTNRLKYLSPPSMYMSLYTKTNPEIKLTVLINTHTPFNPRRPTSSLWLN